MSTYEGYCVKCKQKRSFDGTEGVTGKGVPVAKGQCSVCGTKMTRFLPKPKAA